MRAVPVTWVRDAGKRSGAKAMVVIYVDDDENYGITSWGRTRKECRALRDFIEQGGFEGAVLDINEVVS